MSDFKILKPATFVALYLVLLVHKSTQSTAVQQFKQDPVAFCKRHVISTEAPQQLLNGVRNGLSQKFALSPVPDKTAYWLHPARGGNSIPAHYVVTRQSLEIPAYVGDTIVFTPQLDGCSLYVRYDPGSKKILVYHHYREFKLRGNGQARITQNNRGKFLVDGRREEFDDVLTWEQYGGGVPQSSLSDAALAAVLKGRVKPEQLKHLRQVHVTAFLYRQFDQWYFVYQKFQKNIVRPGATAHGGFKNLGVNIRKIKGIPRLVQKPPPAVLKPTRKPSSWRG